MTQARSSMVDKVRALIAKARSSEFDAEAEACLEKARQLILKYRLDESLLTETPREKGEGVSVTIPFISTRVQVWEKVLANSIADHFGTICLYSSRDFNFVGVALQVELAAFAFEQIRNRLLERLEDAKKTRRPFENPKAFRTSWLLGAATGLGRHLKAIRREAEKTQTKDEFAIVRVDSQIARATVNLLFGTVRTVAIDLDYRNGDAFNDGHNVGSSMSIHEGLDQ